MGTPDEVAQAVLLPMNSDFITGEVSHIDGGGRHIGVNRFVGHVLGQEFETYRLGRLWARVL